VSSEGMHDIYADSPVVESLPSNAKYDNPFDIVIPYLQQHKTVLWHDIIGTEGLKLG
jgi:hypothetical protein